MTKTTTIRDGFDVEKVARCAALFVAGLREELTAAEFNAMRERNALETYKDVCHSHDFCDANMVMAAAFEKVMGREPFTPCDVEEGACAEESAEADCEFFNVAWEMAKPYLTR